MSSLRRNNNGLRSKDAETELLMNDGAGAISKDGVPEMSVCRKLMLSAQLWSMEASCDFGQLYTMPVLQMLGVPLSLLALTGLVAGPSSMLQLPLVGWLTDRGSNPFRRKASALAFASGVLFLGMLLLIVANLVHLSQLKKNSGSSFLSDPRVAFSPAALGNTSMGIPFWSQEANASVNISSHGGSTTDIWAERASSVDWTRTSQPFLAVNVTSTGTPYDAISSVEAAAVSFEMPVQAAVGLLGFILLDLGFDGINSFTKAFVLTCSPRDQHTSILVLGLVMASSGGVSTAALGVVDFTSLLGLSDIEGGSLPVQVIVQSMVIMMGALTGLLFTFFTGRAQFRENLKHSSVLDHSKQDTEVSHDSPPAREEDRRESRARDLLEKSICSFSMSFDPSLVLPPHHGDLRGGALSVGHHRHQPDNARAPHHTQPLLNADGLPQEYHHHQPDNARASHHTQPLLNANGLQKQSCHHQPDNIRASHHAQPLLNRDGLPQTSFSAASPSGYYGSNTYVSLLQSDDTEMCDNRQQKKETRPKCRGFKTRVAYILLATYFGAGEVMMFTYTSTDFVGKAIYNGDPTASPGSGSLTRYEDGLRMASWGFLALYVAYMSTNAVHSRMLALLGRRAEFVLLQVLFALCQLGLALTARLEVFFLTAVVAGVERATYYVIPYSVINEVMQDRAVETGEKSKVGLAMSLVSACIPLAYCTLYTLVGPLEDLTGLVAVPLYMGSVFGCLSALSFLLLGKV